MIIRIQIVIPYESVVVCCLSEEKVEMEVEVENEVETRKRLGMETRMRMRMRIKMRERWNNSATDVQKVWEGTRTVGTKEKRDRANERELVDFVLPFSFVLPHSYLSSLFIWIHSVLISSLLPVPVPILSCVRLALDGAEHPEPNP